MTDMMDKNEVAEAAEAAQAAKPERTLLQSLDTKLMSCPWCGKHFWRRDRECPQCKTRVGELTPPKHTGMVVLQRVYQGKSAEADFTKDSAALLREGWYVTHTDRAAPRGPGFLRIAFLGLFAFLGKRKSQHITAVYRR